MQRALACIPSAGETKGMLLRLSLLILLGFMARQTLALSRVYGKRFVCLLICFLLITLTESPVKATAFLLQLQIYSDQQLSWAGRTFLEWVVDCSVPGLMFQLHSDATFSLATAPQRSFLLLGCILVSIVPDSPFDI